MTLSELLSKAEYYSLITDEEYKELKKQIQPCEDCISREAVMKHLENITMDTNPDNYDNKDKWYQANGFNLCKVGIEMYVKNLPSVTPKTKWIPVSERLPEERIAVLVWCPERKNIYCACYEEKQWWIFGAYFKKVELDVIAWMPLPESYRGDKDGNINNKE